MHSIKKIVSLFCVIMSGQTFALDFAIQPKNVLASPTVSMDIGEQALNMFIAQATNNPISFSTTPEIDARLASVLGSGSASIEVSLTRCEIDFEPNYASLNLSLAVTYDLFTSPKTVNLNFNKTLLASDFAYDISTKRIKMSINKVNDWYNYLMSFSPQLPQYVRDLLVANVSNTFVYWRDWSLGQLDPEFGLPNAPVFWQDPQLTIGFAFKQDVFSLIVKPRIEAEPPRFELYARKLSSTPRQLMIVANANYSNVEIKQTDAAGRTLATNIVSVTNRDGKGRKQRYYSQPFVCASTTVANSYYVGARFFNGKQLIYATWFISSNYGLNDTWQKANSEAKITD